MKSMEIAEDYPIIVILKSMKISKEKGKSSCTNTFKCCVYSENIRQKNEKFLHTTSILLF